MKISKAGLFLTYLALFMFMGTLKSFAGDLYGYIYDKTTDEPLEFVNVVLLRTDSTFVQGTISDGKGAFLVRAAENRDYIMKVSFVGYKTYFKNIVVGNAANQELVRLEPIEVKLDEIVVLSQQPIFQSAAEGLIANVSTSNLKNVGNAIDVVQRVPGVIFEDGKLSVFGKGTPIIYINNRKINDQQELERVLSENISTVELVTNPGAKYSTDGRAVMIIRMKKTKDIGFSALINEKIRCGTRLGDAENINMSYSNKAINIFASYFHDYRNIRTDDRSVYSLTQGSGVSEHQFRLIDRYPSHYYNPSVGLDWSVNDNHSIGAQYEYSQSHAPKATAINTNISFLNGQIPDTTSIYTFTNDQFNQSLINAFYNGKFSEKLSAQLNMDYMNNKTKREACHSEYSSLNTSELNIISKSNYQLWATKLIMEHKSIIGTFEFGGEFSFIKGNGSIVGNDTSFENSIYSSRERKTAGFLSYIHSFKGYQLRTGLRYEFTNERSTDEVLNQNKVSRKYNGVYPNLSLSKKINEVQLSLLFSKKVSRPSITELYNNTAYVNRYILQKGNPYLIQTDLYDINLQAAFKMFHFDLAYSYTKDPITFYSESEAGSDQIITTVTNYDKYQNIDLVANFNHKVSFWQPNYTISLTKPFFSAVYNYRNIDYNKLSFSVRAYNDFTLPQKYILSANFTYVTDRQYMLIDLEHYQKVDLGIRKLFLDDKLKLNLEIWDVFNWIKQNNVVKINNLSSVQYKKRESRFVFLTVSYQLNNYKKSYRGSNASQEDIGRF